MTQAITTPEMQKHSENEYASSWGIDPTKHGSVPEELAVDERDSGDTEADATAKAKKTDALDEYAQAFNDLEDARGDVEAAGAGDQDNVGEDADDGDDDSPVDDVAGQNKGNTK